MSFKNILIENKLLKLDYLVFSSHKTGTQTITRTLNSNGFKCKHCHNLKQIGLQEGQLLSYLELYLKQNNRKLHVITVFRDPMERHISSFFHFYGTRPLRLKELKNESETILMRYTIENLQKRFISELQEGSLVGMPEALHTICEELHIDIDQIHYDHGKEIGLYETEYIKLFVFRFDTFFEDFVPKLRDITGGNIKVQKIVNISSEKWYKDIYQEFKKTLKIPPQLIYKIYNTRRDIITVLFGDFTSVLNTAIQKYGCNMARGLKDEI